MLKPPFDKPDDAALNSDPKPPRPRGLLPQALEELQLSVEELRVAEEEMRVQNDELSRGRLRLEAERQRYQDLFDFAPDGYLVTTLDGTILEANRAASRMLGISTRFLKKRSFATLITSPDLAEFSPRLKALLASGESTFSEWVVQMRRRPAGKFAAAITAVRFQGYLGHEPTLRWLIRDISERMQAEEIRAEIARAEAEEVQRRTQAILDVITDSYVALDQEWRILSMNASTTRLIESAGIDPASLIGEILWSIDPAPMGAEFEAQTMRDVEAGKTVEFEAFSRRLGRWLYARAFSTPRGVSLYANDITERKESEAALQTAYQRERRIAETLQAILLHTPQAEVSSSLAIETFYEAASSEAAVGGDFSDVFTYDGGKIAMVVGDISGKGLQAATLIAEIKYALRTILREYLWVETAIARLNNFVCEAQRQGDFGSDYQVVVSLAVYDPETSLASFVTAGGEPLLLVRAERTAEVVGENGLLLGVMPDVAYKSSEARITSGDTLLLATDGLTEARHAGGMLEFEGLQAQATALLPGAPLRESGQALIESVRHWAGGAFQDDVCLLVARRP